MAKTISFFSIILGLFCCIQSQCIAQRSNKQIIECIKLVARGNSDLVSTKLSKLQGNYSHEPGIYYLEGLLASDGILAIKYFRIVTDSFPNNEWIDDALVRTAEISQNIGLPELVKKSIDRLQKEYPESPYIKKNYISTIHYVSDSSASGPSPQQVQTEYTIQVGAFSIRENAEKLQQRLQTAGYKADIFENLLDGKNLLYLLWVGSFKTMDEAKLQLQTMKNKLNIDGVLRPRSIWKKW